MTVVEELLDNAIRHSGEQAGFFTLERIADSVMARVRDEGVGIHHNMAAESEELSVTRAFLPGPEGTSTGEPTRGGGLYLAAYYTGVIEGLSLCLYTGNTCYIAEYGEGYALSGSGDFHQSVLVEVIAPVS